MDHNKEVPSSDCIIHLHPDGQVVIARHDLPAGLELNLMGQTILVREGVHVVHKLAILDIPVGGEYNGVVTELGKRAFSYRLEAGCTAII